MFAANSFYALDPSISQLHVAESKISSNTRRSEKNTTKAEVAASTKVDEESKSGITTIANEAYAVAFHDDVYLDDDGVIAANSAGIKEREDKKDLNKEDMTTADMNDFSKEDNKKEDEKHSCVEDDANKEKEETNSTEVRKRETVNAGGTTKDGKNDSRGKQEHATGAEKNKSSQDYDERKEGANKIDNKDGAKVLSIGDTVENFG